MSDPANEAARVVRAIEQDIQDALSELYDDPDEVLRAAWELVKDDPRAKGWTLDENGAEAILSPDGEFWITCSKGTGVLELNLYGPLDYWEFQDFDEPGSILDMADLVQSVGLDVTEGSDHE